MKKVFLSIAILFLAFVSKSQVQMSLAAGYNFNKHPIYSLNTGYEKERITINGGFQRSLTRATSSTIIAGGEIGYNLLSAGDSYLLAQSVIISVGYWHISYNTDQKANLASWLPSLSIRYIRMLSENGGLFGQAMCIKNNFSITCGVIFKID